MTPLRPQGTCKKENKGNVKTWKNLCVIMSMSHGEHHFLLSGETIIQSDLLPWNHSLLVHHFPISVSTNDITALLVYQLSNPYYLDNITSFLVYDQPASSTLYIVVVVVYINNCVFVILWKAALVCETCMPLVWLCVSSAQDHIGTVDVGNLKSIKEW